MFDHKEPAIVMSLQRYGLLLAIFGVWGCGRDVPAVSKDSADALTNVEEIAVTKPGEEASDIDRAPKSKLTPLVSPREPLPQQVLPAVAVSHAINVGSSAVDPKHDEARRAFADLVAAYREGRPDQWTRAEASLHQLGLKTLPVLFDQLSSGELKSRELSSMMIVQVLPNLLFAEEISTRPDPADIACNLRPHLRAESVEVRVNIAVALSLIEGEAETVLPVLSELIHAHLPHVRTMAVVALGGLGPAAKNAEPAIERMSQTDADPEAKAAAAQALEMLRASANSY